MSSDPSSEDSSRRDATLTFVIESLKEHEQNLDKIIHKLDLLRPQIDSIKKLHDRFWDIETRLEDLERKIKQLSNYIASNKE